LTLSRYGAITRSCQSMLANRRISRWQVRFRARAERSASRATSSPNLFLYLKQSTGGVRSRRPVCRPRGTAICATAGERARLYFNKLKCNEVDGSLRIAALLYKYPSAMLCGESVLHAAGWITQIPARLSVAVMSRPSYV